MIQVSVVFLGALLGSLVYQVLRDRGKFTNTNLIDAAVVALVITMAWFIFY